VRGDLRGSLRCLDPTRASDALANPRRPHDREVRRRGETVPRQFLRRLVDTFDRIRDYEDYEPLGR